MTSGAPLNSSSGWVTEKAQNFGTSEYKIQISVSWEFWMTHSKFPQSKDSYWQNLSRYKSLLGLVQSKVAIFLTILSETSWVFTRQLEIFCPFLILLRGRFSNNFEFSRKIYSGFDKNAQRKKKVRKLSSPLWDIMESFSLGVRSTVK